MRIMMLSQAYPPLIGGSERFTQDLGRELTIRGHEIVVVTLSHDRFNEFECDGSIRVHRIHGTARRATRLLGLDPKRDNAPPFPDPELCLSLRRIIAKEKPQVVHANDWLVHSFLPLKRWSRAGLIMTLHDYSMTCATKNLMYADAVCSGPACVKCLRCSSSLYGAFTGLVSAIGNWTMQPCERALVDMFVPVSHAVAASSGLTRSSLPYQVIPNFVSDHPSGFHADSAEDAYLLAQLPSSGYLLFVGALSNKKGVDVLLRAYRGLHEAPPLVLIGYGTTEYPADLSSLPPGVIVLRNWPHHAVMAAWQRCLMGLVPSVFPEPFGIVALEPMMYSKPVIASGHGGLVDIVIDGKTGLLARPGDSQALREKIQLLLDNPMLLERMGNAARKRVIQFQAATIVPHYQQLYEGIAHAASC